MMVALRDGMPACAVIEAGDETDAGDAGTPMAGATGRGATDAGAGAGATAGAAAGAGTEAPAGALCTSYRRRATGSIARHPSSSSSIEKPLMGAVSPR